MTIACVNTAPLRIGIVGCGGMGSTHARAYQTDARALVAACADSDESRAQNLAASLNATAYSDAEAMMREQDLHAVSICTPPNSHERFALAAFEHGLHVFCEKPLALSAEQAARMVDAARSAGRLLMTAFCHRFHPTVMAAKRLLDSGRLGRILMWRNRFAGKINMAGRWFSDTAMSGGGTIIDTSVHSIDLFRFMVGEPVSVSARAATLGEDMPVEDTSALLLQTEKGSIGVIEACWTSPHSPNVIETYGSNGVAIVDYASDTARYRIGAMKRWTTAKSSGPDRFTAEIRHFIDCVLGESEPLVTGEDGLKAARIIDAAYESVRQKCWVGV